MLTRDNSHGGPAGPEGHPELEEMAALIDGRLSEERAASLRSHLASCAECREVFFETVDFVLGEEAQGREAALLPFDRPRQTRRWKSRVAVALPAAAVLTLSLGLVYTNFIAAPSVAWAKLARDLSHQQPRVANAFHNLILRGNATPEDEISKQSFRLGVALVNLQVSLEGENRQQADNALAKINGLNDDLRPASDVTKFYRRLRNRLPRHLQPLTERAEKMAGRFRDGPAENLYLDFGMWAEAGHLAAAAGDASFLTSRDNRRFPAYLRRQLKKEGDSLPREVQSALQAIERILERDYLGAKDYRDLGQLYETILKAYDER